MPRLLLTAALSLMLPVLTPAAARADDAPVAAASTPEVTAGLRGEYIVGDAILVPITLRNGSAQALAVPDLRARPWLVTFELELPGGKPQRRRTTPPETDDGGTVLLRPGGERTTLLEVPSGGALAAGAYKMGITVDLGTAEPAGVPLQGMRLVPPRPVDGDVSRASAGRGRLDAVWLHEAGDGFDLFLHEADPRTPGRTVGDWHLAHFAERVAPRLSVSRGQDAANRFVVWSAGDRQVGFLQLQGVQVRGALRTVTTPWPEAETIGSPAVDGTGRLHVPLWVPSPDGKRGELRVMSVPDRGAPAFRKLRDLAARPDAVDVTVDDAGAVHLLVPMPEAVDVYTIRGEPPGEADLPVPGRRLATAREGHEVIGATFGDLPETNDQKGGLAVLVAESGADGLAPRWVSLRGTELAALPPLRWTPGDHLLGLLPDGWNAPGVVVRAAGAGPVYRTATQDRKLPGGSGGTWGLLRVTDGTPLVRRLSAGGPVSVTRLVD